MIGWQNTSSARIARLEFKWRRRRAFRSRAGRAYLPQDSQPAADRAGAVNAESAASNSNLPAAAVPNAAAISRPSQV